MAIKKYNGIVIPAVTPFTIERRLDRAAVEKIFDHFYRHGAEPFILGTTGEASSLPFSLKKEFLQLAGKIKKANTRLYAGISSNVMAESVALARHAFDAGADVVVTTLPSYYALQPANMLRYFEELANAVRGPMMIYNIPATTHMSIPLEVIDQLSHHPHIVGLKDSERSDERLEASIQLWKERSDFSHFLGWAARSANALTNGSDGLVPSTGNFATGIYSRMVDAINNGRHEETEQMQFLSDALGEVYQKGRTLGESLWALKIIMKELGLCEEHVMPPLYSLTLEEQQLVLKAYHHITEKERISF